MPTIRHLFVQACGIMLDRRAHWPKRDKPKAQRHKGTKGPRK